VNKNVNRSLGSVLARTGFIAVLILIVPSLIGAQHKSFNAPDFAMPGNSSIVGSPPGCHILYLGFVGGVEPPNNKYSGVVQLRDTLQGAAYSDVCAKSFSPYVWPAGLSWLMKHFPSQPTHLTPEQLEPSPRVILVGHSMGGWAALAVARELRGRNIPVELTIQVDSVGITDHTVPGNVKSAAIFHANDALMPLTTKHLRVEDPTHTKILADVKVAGVGHESITRDPRIRQLVLETVERLRGANAAKVTSGATAVSLPPGRIQ
jgi:pimeloyl-ACP methyl ester carboxylesterase